MSNSKGHKTREERREQREKKGREKIAQRETRGMSRSRAAVVRERQCSIGILVNERRVETGGKNNWYRKVGIDENETETELQNNKRVTSVVILTRVAKTQIV